AVEAMVAAGPKQTVERSTFVGEKRSIWPSIHPRLVELIEAHRSTMLFVNNRSLAERLSQAINALAGKELSLAHHGSIAKDTRAIIEDRLKRGDLPAIVATSSLELGIDMGAVDLVIQIEAPPSVASGLQRIGRAGHQVDGVSRGVIIPKYRHDLLACAAVIHHMRDGHVEPTFYPRNPLDVLAQQLVAIVAVAGEIEVEALYQLIRGAAPFAELSRRAFDNTLDMLAGRYPSSEFAELRPRLIWDRVNDRVTARKGAQRLAVTNPGTIPDRGLYGVFMLGEGGAPGTRVGELDEEMVFESRDGDVFVLGASSWKIVEITRDRVLVVPAPGEPGRMPFWHGEGPGRPIEFGRAIGALARKLDKLPREQAEQVLQAEHALDPLAARNLMDYLDDQREATGVIPSDKTIVVERWIDEIGDWRVAVLSPFGARVHAPWATAVAARLREGSPEWGGGIEVDMLWTDDGLAFRLPESDVPPPLSVFFPAPEEVEQLVVENLAGSALFAARFRENAARALLLPRRSPGKRTPLWMQRKRSADLLAVAARFRNFPIILETYRECLRDAFDLPGLTELLRQVADRRVRVREVESKTASPFAGALVFTWIGSFLYDDDQPRAERRAQALALDYAQLRELLGDAELRELLDRDAIAEVELLLQRLDPRRAIRDIEQVHDALRELGELSRDELAARCDPERSAELEGWLAALIHARRVAEVTIAGQPRVIAAEDAGRYRDALGVVPPMGLPLAFLERQDHALDDLVARYARTHVPFSPADVATRFGLGLGPIRATLERLREQGRVLEGEFLPGGREREWCDVEVLRRLKRVSLARLSAAVEAVEPRIYARFLPSWHRIDAPGEGLDELLVAIEQIQGVAIPFGDLERAVLPARIRDYHPGMLDQLCLSGEVVWRGFEALGNDDGRVALYLAGHLDALAPAPAPVEGELAGKLRALLSSRGAMFFPDIARALGGFEAELLATLWELVWAGEISNDTLAPLRSRARAGARSKRSHARRRPSLHGSMQLRRAGPPGSEGRWSARSTVAGTDSNSGAPPSETERATAIVVQLLEQFGIVTREAIRSAGLAGGFSAYYPILKAMEQAGKLRRGYFVAGMGGAQFGLPGAEDRLREEPRERPVTILAACDPANAYGAALPWPRRESGAKPQRIAGAHVLCVDGHLLAWLSRSENTLLSFLEPELLPDPNERERLATALAEALVALLNHSAGRRKVMLLRKIDDSFANEHWLAEALTAAGFRKTHDGLLRRRDREWERPSGRGQVIGAVDAVLDDEAPVAGEEA
ncbi:MAG: crosslink repair DNA glycosylase YcaQ family protein, partial [Enhygromyxa sp.]